MTDNSVLACMAKAMEELGLHYAFMEWKGKPVYPYFIGEYQETEPSTEDGMQETSFILTGFSRRTWQELEQAKESIRAYFHPAIGKVITEHGSAMAIFYAGSLGNLPTGDPELKKLQINLTVKEWRV